MAIFPLARDQDVKARFWLLRADPRCGPVVMFEEGRISILARSSVLPNPPRWTYHVCVEAELHCVCALTGPDGTPNDRYIRETFQYPEDIRSDLVESPEVLRATLDRIGRRRRTEHG